MRSLANSLTDNRDSVRVFADPEQADWLVAEFTLPTEAQYKALPRIERAIKFYAGNRCDSAIGFPYTEAERERADRRAARRKREAKAMSIPTDAEILALLDQLNAGKCADDLESYWLDFKPFNDPKDDKRVATEYAVCFANADGGVVVFGVADRERGGRAKAIHGSGNADAAQWERDVYQSTSPHLKVKVEELAVPEGTGRLLLVRIGKGDSPPYGTSQGLYKKRISTNCMPLDLHAEARIQVQTGVVDWSGQPVEGAGLDILDPVELARVRNVLQRLKPASELGRGRPGVAAWVAGGPRRQGHWRTGLLLFGRADELARRCPQHVVQYVYQTSATAVARNEVMNSGLLNILEQIERAFTGPANPEQELSIGVFKLRIPAFPVEDTVREAVLNAVTHRDYLDPGRLVIGTSPRSWSSPAPAVSSPASPRGTSSAMSPGPATRRWRLAFVKLGLVEQAGVGRRRIFIPTLSYGKRMPVYETDGSSVTLRIFNGSYDAGMVKLVSKWRQEGREIDLDGLLILSQLPCTHAFIDTLVCVGAAPAAPVDGPRHSRSVRPARNRLWTAGATQPPRPFT